MKTISVSIDEETWSKAEQKASALETSVNVVVVEYLRRWANGDAIQQAREAMTARFARPTWKFAVGTPDDREQRNARAIEDAGRGVVISGEHRDPLALGMHPGDVRDRESLDRLARRAHRAALPWVAELDSIVEPV